MIRRAILTLMFCLLLTGHFNLSPSSYAQRGDPVTMASQTCYVEVQLGYWAELRRGPSYNYGVKRNIPSGVEMRVFGRNEEGDWFQVYLDYPLNKIGWLYDQNLNFFGHCTDLPVTTDDLEPEVPLDPPPPVPVPNFANDVTFVEEERIFFLNDGVVYVRHEADTLRAHIIIADLSHPKLDVQTALIATPGVRNNLMSEFATESGAFVVINGDFYHSNFIPQNLMLVDYELISAPRYRATFAITEDHTPFMGYFTEDWTWDGSVVAENDAWIPLQWANIPCEDDWLCLYTDIWEQLPLREGYLGIRVLLSPDDEVLSISVDEPLEILSGHRVLRSGVNSEAGRWLRDNLEVGDTIEIHTTTDPDWRDYQFAIGGGPLIVRDGEFWQDCDLETPVEERDCEDFGQDFRTSHYHNAFIARSALGYNPTANTLILIMVEGYSLYGSQGIKQHALAEMFIRFGAETAMEFDGGGSSQLWVRHNSVNGFRESGERRISNALLLFWDD